MSIEFVEDIRLKPVAEYGRIVFSHYAARDAEGYVRQPNWVVYLPRYDSDGEWSGLGQVVDVVPALPEEIPPGRRICPATWPVTRWMCRPSRHALAIRATATSSSWTSPGSIPPPSFEIANHDCR